MVHTGPSKACSNCKARHTRCDLTEPQCLKCVKKGIVCPGFGHKLDIVMRDQTRKVASLYKQPATKRKPNCTDTTGSFDELYFSNLAIEEGARGWFFSTFFSDQRDMRTSHGHLDLVLPRFKTTNSESLLALTITWLSVLILGSSIRGRPYTLEYETLPKIIRLLSERISDPSFKQDEDLLLVIILLQFGEDIRARRYSVKPKPLYMHQRMAEILIRQESHSAAPAISSCLLAAVRQNALHYNFLEPGIGFDHSLWFGSRLSRSPQEFHQNPAIKLDIYGASLLALENLGLTQGNLRVWLETGLPYLQCLEILRELQQWERSVPEDWKPRAIGRLHHVYSSMEVSYLFAQCFWLQLKAVALAQRYTNEAPNEAVQQQILSLFDKIMALEYSLTGESDLSKESVVTPRQDISETLPCVTVSQCRRSAWGARFLDINLRIFDNILEDFLGPLFGDAVVQRAWVCKSWVTRELRTIRLAFPAMSDC